VAKTSIIQRELKRAKLIEKFAETRDAIKKKIKILHVDTTSDQDWVFAEKHQLQMMLDKLPRNSSLKRKRNRCALTGRPRGVYRKFKLGRNMLRKYAMSGQVPGLVKASW
jgi:small subunit ribosomal protein S14